MHNERKYLLSIIVPCYNAVQYIKRCLNSLETLDKSIVSIIFVNDGSTDETKSMLDKWASSHDNAFIINKDNGGYASAINFGLDHCDSLYVMFLGIDDEVVPDRINEICNHLRSNDPDILAFSTIKYYDDAPNEKPLSDSLTTYRKPGLYKCDAYSLYMKIGADSWILFTRDTSRCYKRSVVGGIRYFGKTGVSADGCFASMVACHSSSFEFVNIEAYLWHVHKDSVSGRKKTVQKMIEEANVWKEFFTAVCDSAETVRVPDPVVTHLFSYRKLVQALKDNGLSSEAEEHLYLLKQFSNKLRKMRVVSAKSFIKLTFPSVYSRMIGK